MSTILKSLKKLEQENRNPKNRNPFSGYRGPGSFDSLDANASWFKSAWFKGGLMVAIIFVLGAASLYYYDQTQDAKKYQAGLDSKVQSRPEFASQENDPGKPPPTSRPAVNEIAPVTKNTAPAPDPSPVNKTTDPEPISPAVPTHRRPVPSAPSEAPTAQSAALERGSGKSLIQEGPRSSSKPMAPQPTGPKPAPRKITPPTAAQKPVTPLPSQAKEKQPQQPSREPFNNVPVLSGGPLRVDAIVWSPVSSDRMAVINSRIVYEGDSLDGYTLLAIRPDDVVVRKDGGGRYKVRFGHP